MFRGGYYMYASAVCLLIHVWTIRGGLGDDVLAAPVLSSG